MNCIKLLSLISILSFGFAFTVNAQTANTTIQNPFETTLVKHKMKVKGAGCKTDLGMIVASVKKLAGVKECTVAKHGATSTLEIEYDSEKVDFKTIKAAIENTGTCMDPNARRYKVSV